QVEDYKRPKFEVKFDEIKGSYKLGDDVNVKGNAKSYSGANVDNAVVKYRVVRKAVFPYWWFYWYGYYPSSPEVEILNGTTKTNENGEFDIKFNAIPDKSVPKESKPYFTYSITADVTDINGETRSNNKSVSVGYNSLIIGVEIPSNVDKNDKSDFKIKTTNLNGEFEPAEGTITIYKLKNPDRTLQNSYWAKPDKYLYTKEEYNKLFPNDAYGDENNFYKWEKEFKVTDIEYNTSIDSIMHLKDLSQWNQGMYLAEMKSKDKFGEEVKEQFYFTAFSTGEKKLPYQTYNWFSVIREKGEPGDYASFIAGCGVNSRVLYEIEQDGKILDKQWLNINNEQRYFTIPIKEEYRGNIAIHYTYIVNNRGYSNQQIIEVPNTNKMLDITFETFRNKLQAGENEEWRLKIKGKYGDKVAAEMVATLYDASLDAFKPNNWGLNLYYPYSSKLYWDVNNCFGTSDAYLYQKDWNMLYYTMSIYYDYLNWFGLPVTTSNYRGGYYIDNMDQTISNTNAPIMFSKEEKSLDGKGEFDEGGLTRDKKDGFKEKESEEKVTPVKKTGEKTEDNRQSGEITGVTARKNFNETAFFYPELKTDENGEIIVKFQIPEALTKWKMLGFAHKGFENRFRAE
ncbi:MAG: alpha-2-macroglobulin family protein, partial [Ignavibacteria bacterium]